MALKKNKCYYDVILAVPATVGLSFSTFTTFRMTQLTVGTASVERYGGFMRDVAGIPDSAPAAVRSRQAVSMYWTPSISAVRSAAYAVTIEPQDQSGSAVVDVVITRHFRARLSVYRLAAAGTFTGLSAQGTLVVERQHSIEV